MGCRPTDIQIRPRYGEGNPLSEQLRHEDIVDQAIARVLTAEREAREAVERCREEARTDLARARGSAREVLDRADRRISAVHERCAKGLNLELDRLRAETQRIPREPSVDAATRQRLAIVIGRVAAEMTGG
jgi:vacuolar-type H+-ATPase subunit H